MTEEQKAKIEENIITMFYIVGMKGFHDEKDVQVIMETIEKILSADRK